MLSVLPSYVFLTILVQKLQSLPNHHHLLRRIIPFRYSFNYQKSLIKYEVLSDCLQLSRLV